ARLREVPDAVARALGGDRRAGLVQRAARAALALAPEELAGHREAVHLEQDVGLDRVEGGGAEIGGGAPDRDLPSQAVRDVGVGAGDAEARSGALEVRLRVVVEVPEGEDLGAREIDEVVAPELEG